MKLFRVILPVSDIEAAVRFYAGVFEQAGQRVSAGRHYFDCDGVILACFDPRADGDLFDARPNPDHVYFAVENIEVFFARAQQLGFSEIDSQIKTWPWGERSFYAVDRFGNPLCFVDQRTVFTGK